MMSHRSRGWLPGLRRRPTARLARYQSSGLFGREVCRASSISGHSCTPLVTWRWHMSPSCHAKQHVAPRVMAGDRRLCAILAGRATACNQTHRANSCLRVIGADEERSSMMIIRTQLPPKSSSTQGGGWTIVPCWCELVNHGGWHAAVGCRGIYGGGGIHLENRQ